MSFEEMKATHRSDDPRKNGPPPPCFLMASTRGRGDGYCSGLPGGDGTTSAKTRRRRRAQRSRTSRRGH